VFLLVPAHSGSPGQRAVKLMLLLLYHSEGQCASPCQIWLRQVETLARHGEFSVFQNVGRLPS